MAHRLLIMMLVIYLAVNTANSQPASEPAPTSEIAQKAAEIAAALNQTQTPPFSSSPPSPDNPIRFCNSDEDCIINSIKNRCLTDNSIGLCVECTTREDCAANAQEGQVFKCMGNTYMCVYVEANGIPISNPLSNPPSYTSPAAPPVGPPVGPPWSFVSSPWFADYSSYEYNGDYDDYYLNPTRGEQTLTTDSVSFCENASECLINYYDKYCYKPESAANNGACVECTKDTQCSDEAKPYCSTDQKKCVICKNNSHCSSSIDVDDETCVAKKLGLCISKEMYNACQTGSQQQGIESNEFLSCIKNSTKPGVPKDEGPPPNNNNNSDDTGLVVGLSVGLGCLFLLISSVLFVVCFRRHQKKKKKKNSSRETYDSDEQFFKQCDEGLKDLDSLLVALSSKSSKERDLDIEGSSSWSVLASTTSGSHRVVDFEELKPKSKLGSGSYGLVYLADWDQTSVAVKILTEKTFGNTFSSLIVAQGSTGEGEGDSPVISSTNPLIEAMMQEAELMASLRHPNIVQFLAVCLLPPAIVTEWCVRGSLFGVLKAYNGDKELARQLPWGRRLSMAFDAAKGMLYLHNNRPVPVIHRDLKSPNLLIANDWTVKVADFNLSRLADEHAADKTDGTVGSNGTGNGNGGVGISSSSGGGGGGGGTATGPSQPRWLAPECMRNEPFTAASDVFSFAVVMWELLTGNIPWGDVPKYREGSIFMLIQEGKRLAIPAFKDLPGFADGDGNDSMVFSQVEQYIKLMERCWANDPSERPLFDEIAVVLGEMKSDFITCVHI